jgi:RWP-RK domain
MLRQYTHLPLSGVAKVLGISLTALKKSCRSVGIHNWGLFGLAEPPPNMVQRMDQPMQKPIQKPMLRCMQCMHQPMQKPVFQHIKAAAPIRPYNRQASAPKGCIYNLRSHTYRPTALVEAVPAMSSAQAEVCVPKNDKVCTIMASEKTYDTLERSASHRELAPEISSDYYGAAVFSANDMFLCDGAGFSTSFSNDN